MKQETKSKPKKKSTPIRLIDKVTTTNLDIALRMVGYKLDVEFIDQIIDLVELIEDKGDDVSIKDISKLQADWDSTYKNK